MPRSDTTNLYRHFAADGRLLYVGISLNAVNRLMQHKRSEWFERIARVEIETFDTRDEALAAEARAIKDECPRYNIVGNDKQKPPPFPPELNNCQFDEDGWPRLGCILTDAELDPVHVEFDPDGEIHLDQRGMTHIALSRDDLEALHEWADIAEAWFLEWRETGHFKALAEKVA